MSYDSDRKAWIDRAGAVSIMDEIERRGIELKREGAERVGGCPVCGGVDRFAIHTEKQIFNCRGCGVGGDVIDLVQHIDGVDFIAACTYLAGEPPAGKANGGQVIAAAYTITSTKAAVFYFRSSDLRRRISGKGTARAVNGCGI